MKIGIACSAGSYKGVFIHGVLEAFEELSFRAHVYATCSSSAVPGAFASISELSLLHGTDYWKEAFSLYEKSNHDISKAMISSLPVVVSALEGRLFDPNASRYCIAVCAVTTEEAVEETQGSKARLLGIQLLRAMKNRDTSWADKHLRLKLFQNWTAEAALILNQNNLKDVFYATTRMLHAWKTPSWVDGLAYIDASYRCICPAIELAQLGCDKVVAISPEPGLFYRDLFQNEIIPKSYNSIPIDFIQPESDLSSIGVDYMKVTNKGLDAAFELGKEAGKAYLTSRGSNAIYLGVGA
jgi:hypothetical protein